MHFDDGRITVDSQSARSALALLSILQQARASGTLAAVEPLLHRVAGRVREFQLEFRVRGRPVGRAGEGAHPNWLGRRLTRLPIEMHWGGLVRSVLTAF